MQKQFRHLGYPRGKGGKWLGGKDWNMEHMQRKSHWTVEAARQLHWHCSCNALWCVGVGWKFSAAIGKWYSGVPVTKLFGKAKIQRPLALLERRNGGQPAMEHPASGPN